MKTVWITGGSSGIGYATAKEFLGNGWQVIISSSNEKKLQSAKERLIENNNAQILVHGHIHQPGIYPDQNYTRVVLPDWRPNSLKASFICENKIMII